MFDDISIMYIYIYVCMYACMHVCMYSICIDTNTLWRSVWGIVQVAKYLPRKHLDPEGNRSSGKCAYTNTHRDIWCVQSKQWHKNTCQCLVGAFNPSEKIWTSIGMISNPIYGENKKWQPNHQPDVFNKLVEIRIPHMPTDHGLASDRPNQRGLPGQPA